MLELLFKIPSLGYLFKTMFFSFVMIVVGMILLFLAIFSYSSAYKLFTDFGSVLAEDIGLK